MLAEPLVQCHPMANVVIEPNWQVTVCVPTTLPGGEQLRKGLLLQTLLPAAQALKHIPFQQGQCSVLLLPLRPCRLDVEAIIKVLEGPAARLQGLGQRSCLQSGNVGSLALRHALPRPPCLHQRRLELAGVGEGLRDPVQRLRPAGPQSQSRAGVGMALGPSAKPGVAQALVGEHLCRLLVAAARRGRAQHGIEDSKVPGLTRLTGRLRLGPQVLVLLGRGASRNNPGFRQQSQGPVVPRERALEVPLRHEAVGLLPDDVAEAQQPHGGRRQLLGRSVLRAGEHKLGRLGGAGGGRLGRVRRGA
mmetsp:Transcript_15130/g.47530  ORF Transcript_15130/g.47530 Transcript_15130/m.47530 type:complete len:304 (+) Transcript_15130:243-1154(+)